MRKLAQSCSRRILLQLVIQLFEEVIQGTMKKYYTPKTHVFLLHDPRQIPCRQVVLEHLGAIPR